MSYDLGVWFPHKSLSNEDALEQYYELCNGDISGLQPNPAIDAFYRELCTLHPEIDDVPEDKIGDFDFSPWSVSHDRSDRHVILSCVWSHADYVHDLVLSLALKHGLVVFDPQETILHYPVSNQ
jgi:hypothetical protein